MPTAGTVPEADINVFIGYDTINEVYRAEDSNGSPTNDVARIGGARGTVGLPTAVSWTIKNQTGHDINVQLRNFDRDSMSRCPVIGGDIVGCESLLTMIEDGESVRFDSTLNVAADIDRYEYELFAENAESKDGNIVDPELQIDNNP